ncbi:MAG: class I SAM-dependent methyltransferase [Sphingomicrobium sp.]
MNEAAPAFGQGDVEFQRQLYSDPNPTRRGLHGARRDWVLKQALGNSAPGSRILEVGVGCGVFTEALAAAGRIVTAVDINPAFLANVEKLDSVTTQLKDATLPLELGEHDLAVCSEVLEHVPPDRSQAMLRSLFGALRPGGKLVLTTPQRYATVELGARLFRFKPVLALARKLYGSADELGHINLLTASQLRRQLSAAGFTELQHHRFGFYLPVVAEFGGKVGAAILRAMETAVRPVPVARGLLWTQGWVLERPESAAPTR